VHNSSSDNTPRGGEPPATQRDQVGPPVDTAHSVSSDNKQRAAYRSTARSRQMEASRYRGSQGYMYNYICQAFL